MTGAYVNLGLNLVPPPNGPVGSINLFSNNGYISWTPQNDLQGGARVFTRTFNGKVTANRIYTLPDEDGVIALVGSGTGNPLSLNSLRI